LRTVSKCRTRKYPASEEAGQKYVAKPVSTDTPGGSGVTAAEMQRASPDNVSNKEHTQKFTIQKLRLAINAILART
jgi:hypothetical protein